MKKSGCISLKNSKSCQYRLRMTPAEKESLAAMAKSANTTRAEIIRHALNDYYLNYFIDKEDK